jgi:hypothetical protein
MRIKVKPEGRKGIYLPDKESLKSWIKAKKFKQIHNFIPGSSMFIGADHDVKSVLKDIDSAQRIGILTEEANSMNMGHALSIITNEKLELYDIGEIAEKDLEIR